MFTEDMTIFFNPAEFGAAATLQSGSVVNVIFDNADLGVLNVATTNPVALVRASDIADSDLDKTITINSVVYTIRDMQPQDDGSTVLLQLSVN